VTAYDERLAAVKDWLRRIDAAQDVSPAASPRALEDAARLAAVLDGVDQLDGEDYFRELGDRYGRGDLPDVEARLALGWLLWFCLHAAPDPRAMDKDLLVVAGKSFLVCFLAGAGSAPEPWLPLVIDAAHGVAQALTARTELEREPVLLARTAALWRRILDLTPADHPSRAMRLGNLSVVHCRIAERTGDRDSADKAVESAREAMRAGAAEDDEHVVFLLNYAAALMARFHIAGAPSDLDEAIAVCRDAAGRTRSPRRFLGLSNLCVALRIRYERGGSPQDLEQAVEAGRAAVQAIPPGEPGRGLHLGNLCAALMARFQYTGAAEFLDEAIDLGRQAVESAPPEHPFYAMRLSDLSGFLRERFDQRGDEQDIDEAVSLAERAVAAVPADHPQGGMYLSALNVALLRRYERFGALEDLDRGIRAAREAVRVTPRDHPNYGMYLSNLGISLQTGFRRYGTAEMIDEAVEAGRQAVHVTPRGHRNLGMYLSNLGNNLQVRFARFGRLADLDDAVEAERRAVRETPADHPNHGVYLSNLGRILLHRFTRVGNRSDLEEALEVSRRAADITPAGHYGRARNVGIVAVSLQTRHRREGATADLDRAIGAAREALASTPPGHPETAMRLQSLSILLQQRYDGTGAGPDLDEAIEAARQAVAAVPADHPERGDYLYDLGSAMGLRFERTGAPADLEEMLSAFRAAVAATPPDHPDLPFRLRGLAIALRDRAERTGETAHLDEAVASARRAVGLTPADHPGLRDVLHELAVSLSVRFGHTGAAADAEEAVEVARRAVAATPADDPGRAAMLSGLGLAFHARFRVTGADGDREQAVAAFRQAAMVASAPVTARLRAALAPARLLDTGDLVHAADLLETAVRLLPEAAARHLDRTSRQDMLKSYAGLAGPAAALVLADPRRGTVAHRARHALRLLETGRGVLLGQALDTRTDLTELAERHPALAARFIELSGRLDAIEDSLDAGTPTASRPPDRESAVDRRRRAASAFEKTIEEIRALPGFETFLLPPEPEQLVRHAAHGPIAVLTTSGHGHAAILVTGEGITALPLPELGRTDLVRKVVDFGRALEAASDPRAGLQRRVDAQQEIFRILQWLWDAAAGPVLDRLGYRRTPGDGEPWPRVWWVPTGPLAMLPIHAAGYHREPPGKRGRRTVMDRAVSSYTPTLRALGYAREREAAAPAIDRMLIVAMPATPGAGRLPHVAQEVDRLRRRFPEAAVLVNESTDPAVVTEDTPTRARVLDRLPEYSIAHFACHGSSDAADPSRSMLHLHDHQTAPLTVASLGPVRLENARLAYLSACRTAYNAAPELADESIHLTSAFQLAGYPHVVGTLWEVDDQVATEIADAFYANLDTGRGIDTARAARAVHDAVRQVRDRLPGAPSLWAAHIHAGA